MEAVRPIIIKEGQDVVVHPRSSQLPFRLPDVGARIGRGSTSEVFAVTVDPGYFQYKETNNRNFLVSIYVCPLEEAIDSSCFARTMLLFLYLDRIADVCTSHVNHSRR